MSELTPAGSRAVLVVESDAFGPSVARKLGIAIGAVEGLLIDINAIVPGTRRDVASVTWRKATLPAGTRGEGRAAAKRAAVGRATAMLKERYGIAVDLPVDAAEALLILEWARGQYAFGEVLAPC